MGRAAVAALGFAVAVAGCGGSGDASGVAAMQMALSPSSGLNQDDIGAVEILVFDGKDAGCARVMDGVTPLDDAGLVVVAHALFTIDGTPKHLAIPAGKPLDFYAEAFRSAAPGRTRIGRGCADQTLHAGGSTAVTVAISASN